MYSVVKDIWFHITDLRPEEDTLTIRNGFFTPPAPPSTSCEPGATFSNPAAGGAYPRTVVGEYESDYASRSGVVLVNVAPIPSCDENLAAFSSELNGVTSNSLEPLPVRLFNDPRHYTADGSTIVSRMVAQEVNAVAQHNPHIYDHIYNQIYRQTSYPSDDASPGTRSGDDQPQQLRTIAMLDRTRLRR
jgi:hypothetical protein